MNDGVTITAYEDGPLLVRGDVTFLTQDGTPIDPGRSTVALCRCGKSARKPFCDGTHKLVSFRAPSTPTPSAASTASAPSAPSAQ